MNRSFGQALREWRLRNGLSFRGAGKRFGVTGSHIFKLESGDKNPSLGLLSIMPDELIDAWRDQEIQEIQGIVEIAEFMKMRRREVESWTENRE